MYISLEKKIVTHDKHSYDLNFVPKQRRGVCYCFRGRPGRVTCPFDLRGQRAVTRSVTPRALHAALSRTRGPLARRPPPPPLPAFPHPLASGKGSKRKQNVPPPPADVSVARRRGPRTGRLDPSTQLRPAHHGACGRRRATSPHTLTCGLHSGAYKPGPTDSDRRPIGSAGCVRASVPGRAAHALQPAAHAGGALFLIIDRPQVSAALFWKSIAPFDPLPSWRRVPHAGLAGRWATPGSPAPGVMDTATGARGGRRAGSLLCGPAVSIIRSATSRAAAFGNF